MKSTLSLLVLIALCSITAARAQTPAPSTRELIDRFYQGVPVKGQIGEYETLLSNRKARAMLGFEPQHSWRKYVEVG